MRFDDVRVAADRRLGDEGDGLKIALAGLDSGRLGIAAVATGLAQGALDDAVAYAQERETFGKPIIDHQGLGVRARRHGRRGRVRPRDVPARPPGCATRGCRSARQASIAKLVATDNAMKVTTDAVQVLGGYGYTRDFPVERYMREAKVMQIFEGTNQIQRMVIGRALAKNPRATVTTAPAPTARRTDAARQHLRPRHRRGVRPRRRDRRRPGRQGRPGLRPRPARPASTGPPTVDGVTYVATDVTDPAQVAGRGGPGRGRRPAAHGGELRGHRPVGADPGQEGRARPRAVRRRSSRST